jgi:hypothetical protein
MRLVGLSHICGKREIHAKIGRKIEERDCSERLGVDGNIRITLKQTGWKDVEWIHLHQDEH